MLENEEATWRLKSTGILLEKGDKTTKLFQNYAKHRKNINDVWDFTKIDGSKVETFQEIAKESVTHFKTLQGAK